MNSPNTKHQFKLQKTPELYVYAPLIVVPLWWWWEASYAILDNSDIIAGIIGLLIMVLIGYRLTHVLLVVSKEGVFYRGPFGNRTTSWDEIARVKRISGESGTSDFLVTRSSKLIPLSNFESFSDVDAWRNGELGNAIRRSAPANAQSRILKL